MSANFLLFPAVVVASAVAAAACILAFAAVLHWGRDRESGLLPYLFYPAVGIVTLGVILSGRRIDMTAEASLLLEMSKPPALAPVSKLVSLFLLFAAGERIMNAVMRLRPAGHPPFVLFLALTLFYATNVVCSALLAAHPYYSNEYLYSGIAAAAALLSTPLDRRIALAAMRNVGLILLMLSIAWLPWRPEMVLEMHYQGWIPFLHVRYAGLTSGPNALGGFVVLFMLCLWAAPFRSRTLRLLGWGLGAVSLFLCQSKTSWAAFLVCAGLMLHFRARQTAPSDSAYWRRNGVLLLCFGIPAVAGAALLSGAVVESIKASFHTDAGGDLLTLVGRTVIWDVAIEEWRNNPLFGYGLTIWDSGFRSKIGLPDAMHAHNQFFQSLSSAGIVGVLGLATYCLALLWFSMRTARASRGLSIAIFCLVFIRAMSEVPLSMAGYGMEQLTHLLLLIVIAPFLTEESMAEQIRLSRRARFAFVN